MKANNNLAIERVLAPGRSSFEEHYLAPPGRPVILTDVVSKWPAFGKWTFDYLSAAFEDAPVVPTDQLFTPKKAFRMTMRTFLELCQDPSLQQQRVAGSPLYVGLQPFSLNSTLMTDFIWPEQCDNLYAQLGDDVLDWYLRQFGVLLIGTAGTRTPDHVDLFGTHAWLAQLCGSKHFVFEAPEHERQSLTQRDGTDQYEAFVHAGDMIVFPQGWRHSVTSLSPSISLSFNFVNQTNYAAHLLEIFRELPAFIKRLDKPELRRALKLNWTGEAAKYAALAVPSAITKTNEASSFKESGAGYSA